MKKITLTVDINGSAISREYSIIDDFDRELWNDKVNDMIDTIEKSAVTPF